MCYLVQNYDTYFAVNPTYLDMISLSNKHACVREVQYIANINIGTCINSTDVSIHMRSTREFKF